MRVHLRVQGPGLKPRPQHLLPRDLEHHLPLAAVVPLCVKWGQGFGSQGGSRQLLGVHSGDTVAVFSSQCCSSGSHAGPI